MSREKVLSFLSESHRAVLQRYAELRQRGRSYEAAQLTHDPTFRSAETRFERVGRVLAEQPDADAAAIEAALAPKPPEKPAASQDDLAKFGEWRRHREGGRANYAAQYRRQHRDAIDRAALAIVDEPGDES